jgi:hypothetical protein
MGRSDLDDVVRWIRIELREQFGKEAAGILLERGTERSLVAAALVVIDHEGPPEEAGGLGASAFLLAREGRLRLGDRVAALVGEVRPEYLRSPGGRKVVRDACADAVATCPDAKRVEDLVAKVLKALKARHGSGLDTRRVDREFETDLHDIVDDLAVSPEDEAIEKVTNERWRRVLDEAKRRLTPTARRALDEYLRADRDGPLGGTTRQAKHRAIVKLLQDPRVQDVGREWLGIAE